MRVCVRERAPGPRLPPQPSHPSSTPAHLLHRPTRARTPPTHPPGTIARGAAETGAAEAYMCSRIRRNPSVRVCSAPTSPTPPPIPRSCLPASACLTQLRAHPFRPPHSTPTLPTHPPTHPPTLPYAPRCARLLPSTWVNSWQRAPAAASPRGRAGWCGALSRVRGGGAEGVRARARARARACVGGHDKGGGGGACA